MTAALALALLSFAATPGEPAAPTPPAPHAVATRKPPLPTFELPPDVQVTRELLALGTHWRFTVGERGAVHVFRPRGYDVASAGTVVYVHGYFTSVDEAWEQHHLLEQFVASGRNALFIVPEAPVSNPDTVKWDKFGELLAAVRAALKLRIPDGAMVVMGHSGAFRTIVPWLESPRIDEIVLLDGLYHNEDDFEAWMKTHPRALAHRLIVVGFETQDRTDAFIERFPDAVERPSIPESPRTLSHRISKRRVVYIRSQLDHMSIVTSGKVIPLLLEAAPLPPLPHKLHAPPAPSLPRPEGPAK